MEQPLQKLQKSYRSYRDRGKLCSTAYDIPAGFHCPLTTTPFSRYSQLGRKKGCRSFLSAPCTGLWEAADLFQPFRPIFSFRKIHSAQIRTLWNLAEKYKNRGVRVLSRVPRPTRGSPALPVSPWKEDREKVPEGREVLQYVLHQCEARERSDSTLTIAYDKKRWAADDGQAAFFRTLSSAVMHGWYKNSAETKLAAPCIRSNAMPLTR